MKKFCLFLLLTTLFSISSTFANAASAWQKYPGNPIINIGQQGWKSSHAWSPFVIKIDHAYQMWYAGYDGNYWRIGNASSTDGINWSDNVNNPIIDNSSINENVTEPTLIFHNGTYKMWYVSVNKQNNQSTIKYTTSNDGIHWSTSITVLTRTQGWEISYLAHPEISLLNNEYRIFYTGNSGSVWRIGYATSTDGVNWNKYQNNPILNPSSNETPTVGGSSILYEAGKYIMYYHSNHPPNKINLATSTDGVNWTRDAANPILTTSSAGFDRTMIAAPAVIKEGNLYKMWYSGYNGSQWSIGYATMSAEANLEVPLFKQTQEPWHLQTYDLANLWNPLDPTIHAWGCALTSAAMILQYHGFNKLPDGTILNPGTLNDWLNDQPDGYVATGWLNWLAISRLSKQAKTVNGITAFDALEYNRKNGEDKTLLATDLNSSRPDILEEPGHFIVAKGINGDTFNINDPAYNRLTLNDGYSNTFLSLGRYIPTSTDLSYILLVTDENLQITLKDSEGNILGEQFVQQPIISISNPSQTNGSPLKIFYLPKPQSGEYSLTLTAPGDKLYNLDIYLYDEDGNVNILSVDGIAGQSQTENLIINFDNKNSQNSKTEKNPTFQSTIEDIREGMRLKLIQKDVADALIDFIKNAEKSYKKGLKKPTLAKLDIAKKLLNKTYEKTNGLLLKESLYQILLYDLDYLKNHL